MRILVVEDERKVAADLGRALEGSGLVVEQVSDGETAWFQGDTENYDLVVLDLGLPNRRCAALPRGGCMDRKLGAARAVVGQRAPAQR